MRACAPGSVNRRRSAGARCETIAGGSEPATVTTDYLLALLGVWLGVVLWRHGARRGQWAPRLLAGSFAVLAAGAFLGGTAHGFQHALAPAALGRL